MIETYLLLIMWKAGFSTTETTKRFTSYEQCRDYAAEYVFEKPIAWWRCEKMEGK